MPKKILTLELEGTRRRGRPRKGWREEVERDLQVLGAYAHHQEVQPYVYNNWYLLFFLDDCLLSWLDWHQYKSNTVLSTEKYCNIELYI